MITEHNGHRIATFCTIQSSVTTIKEGVTSTKFVCATHKVVELVPYFVGRSVVYACKQCLEEHLKNFGAIIPAKEKADIKPSTRDISETCDMCNRHENLEDCEMCGKAMCPIHMVESVCESCARGIDTCGVSHAWYGV